jgi:hypothetical protein
MSEKNFIVPAIVETTSLSAQIVAAHGLAAFKTKLFKVPQSLGVPDGRDNILNGQESNYLLSELVFDTVTFMGNNSDGSLSYYDLSTQQVVTIPKMQLPIALCSVTKNIKIVKSDIAGRNGTVKQYINTGDYDVTIKGIFTTGVSDKYPESAMLHLNKITNASVAIKVASNFLHMFGITYLVFERCDFEQMEDAGRDEQKFTLQCVSDIPFLLKTTQQGGTTSNNFGNTVTATTQ